MDLYSRRFIGWSMGNHITRHLVLDALQTAINTWQPAKGLIIHSDRGAQYTSDDYQQMLTTNGMKCSMSAARNCYDNAVVESFFGMMKRELTNRYKYRTREEATAKVFEYIECFYNIRRKHGHLRYLSPNEFERKTLNVN